MIDSPINRLYLKWSVLINDLRLLLLLVHAIISLNIPPPVLLNGLHFIEVVHLLHVEVPVEAGRRPRPRSIIVVTRGVLEQRGLVLRYVFLFVGRDVLVMVVALEDSSLDSILRGLAGVRLGGF